MISVVIPTWDEGARLAPALERLKAQAPDAEIVIADAGSTDGTLDAARAGAHVLVKCPRRGRAHQMDLGLRASSGKVVVFLHADTALPDGWPDALLAAFSTLPPPAWASWDLRFDDPRPVFRVLERGHALRERLTGVPHGDQGLAVLRPAYLACGGFPEVPLMEEYELARRIRAQGAFVRLPGAALTSTRRYDARGLAKTVARHNALIALWELGVTPAALARLVRR